MDIHACTRIKGIGEGSSSDNKQHIDYTAINVCQNASHWWVLHHLYLYVRQEKVTNCVASDDNSRYTFEGNDVSQ